MNPIFCDSSGFYALIDASEAQHPYAAAAWERLIRERHRLVTSNYVITETIAVVQARIGLKGVRAALESIQDCVEVAWVDRPLHDAAVNELLTHNRRRLSLVDCTSFGLMRRHRIDAAFAVDPDFEEHGFTLFRA
jgi:predicted nucleic acid-binding protein